MDVSLWPASWRSWSEVAELAHLAEQSGWHGLWLADHLMLDSGSDEPADGDCHDAWSFLPALAATTSRIRLGSLVAPVTFRHPATLAAAATSIAAMSGGRFVLGVGAGWQRNEHAAYAFPLGSRRERSDRLEEACRVLRGLLDDTRPVFGGQYFQVDEPPRHPSPHPPVPILVGGKGRMRTLRTAARYAQEWNGWCDAQLLDSQLAALRVHCHEIGRDPSTIRCSVNTYLAMHDDPAMAAALQASAGDRPCLVGNADAVGEQLEALTAAGADEVVIVDWNLDDRDERTDALIRLSEEVLPQLR